MGLCEKSYSTVEWVPLLYLSSSKDGKEAFKVLNSSPQEASSIFHCR